MPRACPRHWQPHERGRTFRRTRARARTRLLVSMVAHCSAVSAAESRVATMHRTRATVSLECLTRARRQGACRAQGAHAARGGRGGGTAASAAILDDDKEEKEEEEEEAA